MAKDNPNPKSKKNNKTINNKKFITLKSKKTNWKNLTQTKYFREKIFNAEIQESNPSEDLGSIQLTKIFVERSFMDSCLYL